jgi:hypothetical protein
MAAKNPNPRRAAQQLARERRLKLDAGREAKDRRIEEATAVALMALDEREEAERAVAAATAEMAQAIRELLADDLTPEQAADLIGMTPAEVRRLAKVGSTPEADRSRAVASGAE